VSLLGLLAGVALLIAIAVLLWYLLIETEGVYLGRRVVVWLYDIYAWRYDHIKEFDDISDHLIIAQPLMRRLGIHNAPMVLDVGTGTARLPLALCQHASFEGFIIGLDMSLPMLKRGQQKMAQEHFADYIQFVRADGQRLPYDDGQFDIVTCLEALEFLPKPREALSELVRVLTNGGWLVITLRQGVQMPTRVWDEATMYSLLDGLGCSDISIDVWQEDYKLVWARKQGTYTPQDLMPAHDITRCPNCEQFGMDDKGAYWQCSRCDVVVTYQDGIMDLLTVKNTH
jgi:ubiquinone/menaquinone biosynthesis C-methylase UbiE